MMTEQDYWNYKCNLDRTYGDQLFQVAIDTVNTENEYKLFSMLKPLIYKDGDKWCCLYGENLQVGIAGFGDTPHLAILDFNKTMNKHS